MKFPESPSVQRPPKKPKTQFFTKSEIFKISLIWMIRPRIDSSCRTPCSPSIDVGRGGTREAKSIGPIEPNLTGAMDLKGYDLYGYDL